MSLFSKFMILIEEHFLQGHRCSFLTTLNCPRCSEQLVNDDATQWWGLTNAGSHLRVAERRLSGHLRA